jgi:hypothetical protein
MIMGAVANIKTVVCIYLSIAIDVRVMMIDARDVAVIVHVILPMDRDADDDAREYPRP